MNDLVGDGLVEWLTVPLKYVASINDEALSDTTDPDRLLSYVDIGNVSSGGEILGTTDYTFEKAPSRARRLVRHGDVIVSTVRTYLQAIAPVEHPLAEMVVSTGFAVVRPDPSCLDPRFCKYALRDSAFLGDVQRHSAGVSYPAITATVLGTLRVSLPPLVEQQAIAADLDRETARIDALIATKTAFVERLGEKRRTLVSEAITRGLDPAAPRRDSGVPWLGEIPAHWETTRLKFIAHVRGGVTKGRDLGKAETVNVPYLRVANVQDGYLDLRNVSEIEVLDTDVEAYALRAGDLLMNEGGDIDKLGRGTVWEGEINPCIHQNHVFSVRCHSVDPYWLSAFTGTARAKAYFEMSAKRSTNLASISATSVRNLTVPLPPVKEQTAILTHILESLDRLDRLVRATEASVALLRERRGALISATVTGRRRVST